LLEAGAGARRERERDLAAQCADVGNGHGFHASLKNRQYVSYWQEFMEKNHPRC
jgi:hypothetical protein